MKHTRLFHSALGILAGFACAGALSSCTRSEVAPPDGGGNNSLTYGDTHKSISSVVYTVDEDKVYTFYFSPTKDLASLNAMLLADNYIKIVTKTPTGDIDLLNEGNSLSYEDVAVSAGTSDKVSKSSLSLKLTSTSSITMNLDVATDGAQPLAANYEGLCYNVTPAADGKIRLDKQIFFYYYGPTTKSSNINDYYLAVTDLKSWSGSGQSFSPTSEGYILTLDFYGEAGSDWKDFPDGTFEESDSKGSQTYYSASSHSFVTYCAPDGTATDLQLTGEPVTIRNNGDGTYTITANFIDLDDNDKTLEYTGELNISNGTIQTYLEMIGDDVEFDGVPSADDPGGYASAVYYGDVYDTGAGMMYINLYDKKGSNKQPGGHVLALMIFTRTFSEDPYIEEGTYTVGSTMKQWSAYPGVEAQLLGGIIPWGTYAAVVNEKLEEGPYSFASAGEINIKKTEDGRYYHVSFDLESIDGHVIKGEFQGDIPLTDASEDDDGNDGSTNLETDVEMDLSYLPSATCSLPSEIYTGGLGFIPVESIHTGVIPQESGDPVTFTPVGQECGYQIIDIGPGTGYFEPHPDYPTTGKLHPGDIIRVDLLVEPGTEDRITPGTYAVSANRYPAVMKPGVCLRGYTGVTGNAGTRYHGITEIIGSGFPYGLADHLKVGEVPTNSGINIGSASQFACIYGGSVTISVAEPAADGTPQFTFEFKGLDVINHEITGSWTGPVYIGGDKSKPMQPVADASESSVSAAAGPVRISRDMIPSRETLMVPGWRLSL